MCVCFRVCCVCISMYVHLYKIATHVLRTYNTTRVDIRRKIYVRYKLIVIRYVLCSFLICQCN